MLFRSVAMCAGIPNIKVFAPSNAEEMQEILRRATRGEDVWLVRYPRDVVEMERLRAEYSSEAFDLYGDINAKTAIVTYSRLFYETGKLHKKVRICKLKQLFPIDPKAVESVMDCERVFFFEEGARSGGVGEHFALELLERGFKGQYKLMAVDGFVRHASVEELLAEYGLNTAEMEKLCEV